MGQRVLVVNAFATEPMTGIPFVVIPEGELSETQRQRVGTELGAVGTVAHREGTLTYTESKSATEVDWPSPNFQTPRSPVSAAVAGCTGLPKQGQLSAGEQQFETLDFPGIERLSVADDGSVEVTVETQSIEQPELTEKAVASALGLNVETLKDVGADLPLGRSALAGGTLFVPVNFLEHLSHASPERTALRELCDTASVTRVMAITFDTLKPDSTVHARVFQPAGHSIERAADGTATAGCATYLLTHSVFDGEYDQIQFESGYFTDRPATLSVTLDAQPTVIGRGLSVLEGTVVVPAEQDDDIIEVQ